jgi:hypothetical protein
VIHVPNRPHVHVRLGPLEFLLGHLILLRVVQKGYSKNPYKTHLTSEQTPTVRRSFTWTPNPLPATIFKLIKSAEMRWLSQDKLPEKIPESDDRPLQDFQRSHGGSGRHVGRHQR